MTTQMFQVDGADVTLEERAFRQIVYWNHRHVSEISIVRPRLVVRHRFPAPESSRQVEIRSYPPGLGRIVLLDGHVVDTGPPKKWPRWLGVFALVSAAINALEYRREPGTQDLVSVIISGLMAIAFLLPELIWWRAERQVSKARAGRAGAA